MAFVEAPPQFSGAPKKSKTGLIIGLVCLAILLLCCGACGLGGYFLRGAVGKALGLVECSTAMAQQRDGLLGYAAAHGGKLPGAGTWQDDIKPYVSKLQAQTEKQQMFTIPTPQDNFCDKGGSTSLTFNSDVAGKKIDEVKEPYETIALFETPGIGRNRSAAFKEQPFDQSPVILKGKRRGWIVQPLKGQASYKDERGRVRPATGISGSAQFNVGSGSAKGGPSSED